MYYIAYIVIVLISACVLWHKYTDRKLIKSVTSFNRGERSERRAVLRLLKLGIPPRAIFHDCYFYKSSGFYTQADLVVATRSGLIVFEIKDYGGWIYGDSHQKYWTQSLAHGHEKHKFYNPVMQNRGHIRAIRDNLCSNWGIPIYSVVVFYGDCKLKHVKVDDENVYVIRPSKLKKTVISILRKPEARYGDKREVMKILTQAVRDGENPKIVSDQREAACNISRYALRRSLSLNSLSLIFRLIRW